MMVVADVRLLGGADGIDGGLCIVGTINGAARHKDIGARGRHERGRLGIDATIDFDVAVIAEVMDFMRKHMNLIER